jgi:hypothetical protein
MCALSHLSPRAIGLTGRTLGTAPIHLNPHVSLGPIEQARRERWLATLDPGIAPYVDWLDSKGIETFESCEGGEGHGFLEPTIRFYGDNSEGFRALAVAVQRELPVAELRRYWQVSRAGEPEGPHWELTFRGLRLFADLAQRPTIRPAP